MGTKDKRIDAYIAKSPDFAQPILKHIRQVVHRACPDVEETLKWKMPTFMYKGMLCGMAAFNQHAVFGFWKEKLMKDPHKLFTKSNDAMRSWGRITSIVDLPSDAILADYIHEAMQLNEKGIKIPRMQRKDKKPVRVPPYFKKALAKNKKALETFEAFSPSHKREYVEWVTEAKTEETRTRRLAKTVELLTQGKGRNWKYTK